MTESKKGYIVLSGSVGFQSFPYIHMMSEDVGEKQIIREGHNPSPLPSDLGNSGFDYRMKDEKNGLDFSHRTNGEYEMDMKLKPGVGFEVGYLPPDQRPGLPTELLSHLQLADPEIGDDTEAAEALRANATVKVGKVGKVARSVGAQSVRKVAKRLTLRGQSGNRRGKPPRIPPGMTMSQMEAMDAAILAVAEASKEDDSIASDFSDAHEQEKPMLISDAHASERYAVRQDVDGSTIRITKEQPNSEIKDIPLEVTAGTMDAGRKLMGAIDPHNLLQLQRWRRKNKKGKKDKRKSYVKGKVIDRRHELYALSIAVMLGVRTSIARTNTIIASSDRNKLLSPQDFMAEEKYEFSPKGSATTPPHKLSHTFKFKDYAPVAFAYLRRMFGVNEFDFLLSVCGNANFIEFISNAKSGQFFFYSSDGKYMIKTMTNAESKFLRRSKSATSPYLHFLWRSESHICSSFLRSIAPLLSPLHSKSQYSHYEVSGNVSCQALSPSTECQICHYEFSLLHRQIPSNILRSEGFRNRSRSRTRTGCVER